MATSAPERDPGVGGKLAAVAVTLHQIADENREAVLAVRVAPGQERLIGSVASALEEAAGNRMASA